jgi:putative FmdB family regulatory protein
MPIYEYECKKCHKKFDKLVKVGEANAKCPHCNTVNTKKLISKLSLKSSDGCSHQCHGCFSCGHHE